MWMWYADTFVLSDKDLWIVICLCDLLNVDVDFVPEKVKAEDALKETPAVETWNPYCEVKM